MVQCMQINVIHHIKERKDENHSIISRDTEKTFEKNEHLFMVKTLNQSEYRGSITNAIYSKPADTIIHG